MSPKTSKKNVRFLTNLGAVLIFRESLNPLQWLGFSITTAAFAWFLWWGKKKA